MYSIREITLEDSANFLSLLKQIDQETKFLMFEPGERQTTLTEIENRIGDHIEQTNSNIFVAERENKLVGYLAARGGRFRKNAHSAYLVVAITQEHTGQGVGTLLFETMEQWATTVGIHRLELTCMTHNHRAVGLYKKRGFIVEGTKQDSLKVAGEYVDEYYMAKLLIG